MWALEAVLDRILAEGLETRFERHSRMAARTQAWAAERFELFAQPGYRSQTVTCVKNTWGMDVGALNKFLRARHMQISDGYGRLKNDTFRIAHMGEICPADLEALLARMDEFIHQAHPFEGTHVPHFDHGRSWPGGLALLDSAQDVQYDLIKLPRMTNWSR